MMLVDTSVWVDHLRDGNDSLGALLDEGSVLCHPFVIGEIACGFLKNRNEILGLLGTLPQAPLAEMEELLLFIGRHSLAGRGIGFVDAHLLAAAFLAGCRLFTLDRRLRTIASGLGLT